MIDKKELAKDICIECGTILILGSCPYCDNQEEEGVDYIILSFSDLGDSCFCEYGRIYQRPKSANPEG